MAEKGKRVIDLRPINHIDITRANLTHLRLGLLGCHIIAKEIHDPQRCIVPDDSCMYTKGIDETNEFNAASWTWKCSKCWDGAGGCEYDSTTWNEATLTGHCQQHIVVDQQHNPSCSGYRNQSLGESIVNPDGVTSSLIGLTLWDSLVSAMVQEKTRAYHVFGFVVGCKFVGLAYFSSYDHGFSALQKLKYDTRTMLGQ
jgi:hypothetical protein